MAGLGVAYVFRDELVESSYLVSLAQKRVETSREQVIEHFAQDAVARKYIELTSALGRAPIATEFDGYPDLQERFGSLGRIERLARHALSMEAIEESRQRRREDILTYMAMARLRNLKEIPFRLLPQDLRADIKTLWPSYSAALREGESFLFRIGNPELVREACQTAPVGKKFPDALYVHRSAEEQLGALLRLVIFASRQIVGELEYNVVKIATDGRKLSFLQYGDFDEQAHPELRHSVRVFLPRASYLVRNYSASLNPPILHRKETLVDVLYQFQPVTLRMRPSGSGQGSRAYFSSFGTMRGAIGPGAPLGSARRATTRDLRRLISRIKMWSKALGYTYSSNLFGSLPRTPSYASRKMRKCATARLKYGINTGSTLPALIINSSNFPACSQIKATSL
jgi:DNA phosphorothioation-associated putative methyltransferase